MVLSITLRELARDAPQYQIPLLLVHEFTSILSPLLTGVGDRIHTIVHKVQPFRSFVQLPRKVLTPALLAAGCRSWTRRPRSQVPLHRRRRIHHALARRPAGAADQEVEIGGRDVLRARQPLHVGDGGPRRYFEGGVDERVGRVHDLFAGTPDLQDRELGRARPAEYLTVLRNNGAVRSTAIHHR